MRSIRNTLLTSVACLLLSANLHSSCGTQTVEIRHINGIWTDEAGAIKNMEELLQRLGTTHGDATLVYAYSYNDSNGALDLYYQKEVEDNAEKARELALTLLAGQTQGADQATIDRISADYQELLAESQIAGPVADTVIKIANEVSASIQNGTNVVLVPHSQGGLYANSVFGYVTAANINNPKLKIAGVAETAAFVAGDQSNTSYVTAHEDKAISILRLTAAGTVLPSNTPAGTSLWTDWFTSHDFQNVYLNPEYTAWPKVRQTIANAINSLQPEGKIKVTASWDPLYPSLDFGMFVNGIDQFAMTGFDPALTLSPGSATYCVDWVFSALPTTYTPKLTNRGSLAQSAILTGPLGLQTLNVPAQTGFVPGFAIGTAFKLQNGIITPY